MRSISWNPSAFLFLYSAITIQSASSLSSAVKASVTPSREPPSSHHQSLQETNSQPASSSTLVCNTVTRESPPNDPQVTDVAAIITSAASSACSALATTSPQSIANVTFQGYALFAGAEADHGPIDINICNAAIKSIVNDCIIKKPGYSGQYFSGGQLFNLTNIRGHWDPIIYGVHADKIIEPTALTVPCAPTFPPSTQVCPAAPLGPTITPTSNFVSGVLYGGGVLETRISLLGAKSGTAKTRSSKSFGTRSNSLMTDNTVSGSKKIPSTNISGTHSSAPNPQESGSGTSESVTQQTVSQSSNRGSVTASVSLSVSLYDSSITNSLGQTSADSSQIGSARVQTSEIKNHVGSMAQSNTDNSNTGTKTTSPNLEASNFSSGSDATHPGHSGLNTKAASFPNDHGNTVFGGGATASKGALPVGGDGITIDGFTTINHIPLPTNIRSSATGAAAALAAIPSLATEVGSSYAAAAALAASLGAAAEGAVSDVAVGGLERSIFSAFSGRS